MTGNPGCHLQLTEKQGAVGELIGTHSMISLVVYYADGQSLIDYRNHKNLLFSRNM